MSSNDPVRLTPARERLLRAVARGEVEYRPTHFHPGGRETPHRWTWNGRAVTKLGDTLASDLRLITYEGSSRWQRLAILRDAGRAWLAANPERGA